MEKSPRTKQEYLRQLIDGKNRWNSPPAAMEADAGPNQSDARPAKSDCFLGWHERGYLPHRDETGLTQFITFRLGDSFPQQQRREWQFLLTIEDEREKRRKLETYLDKGWGECHLRHPGIATFAQNALLHHAGRQFQMLAWVIMPNHVHVLVRVERVSISRLVQNWKSIIAVTANKQLNRVGRFWQPEYWDRYMRDEEQTRKAIRYIEQNPVKAHLCRQPEDWLFSSARYRDPQSRALSLPLT
ncbi:MAG: REP-associated tyrosine transposase [Verrucomicrobiota bacterium]